MSHFIRKILFQLSLITRSIVFSAFSYLQTQSANISLREPVIQVDFLHK